MRRSKGKAHGILCVSGVENQQLHKGNPAKGWLPVDLAQGRGYNEIKIALWMRAMSPRIDGEIRRFRKLTEDIDGR